MSPSRQERQKGVLSPSTEQPESKSCPQAGGRSAEGGSEHQLMMPEGDNTLRGDDVSQGDPSGVAMPQRVTMPCRVAIPQGRRCLAG